MSGPVVELSAGRIAGRTDGDVLIFQGIPYGGSPAGANRFGPPPPVLPWAGIREATSYGPTAVQPPPPPARLDEGKEIAQGEDCLVLNVWTAGLTGSRPVLFWIHGGGFSTGSGSAPWYEGSALAAHGDVVVVTVNHRLGLLGFLDLPELAGGAGADSANAGMLDLVAALRWVREHIASFGGDPGRVTIFGESGGGGKVATLLAMPDAAGLFHRGAIQSGIFRGGPGQLLQDKERATAIARRVVAELGSVDELLRAPAARLLEVQRAVEAERTPGTASVMAFCPTVDGRVVTDHPQSAVAAGASAEVPLIIGTNRDEVTLFLWLSDEGFRADPLGWSPDDDTLAARLAGSCGGRTAEILEQYRALRPDATNGEQYVAIASDNMRVGSIEFAEARCRTGGAPVHLYLFTWESPVQGGALRSAHGFEIPFVFDATARRAATRQAGGPLASQMSGAWVEFAKTGRPSIPGVGDWPPYDTANRPTVVFGAETRVVADPFGGERRAWLPS